MSAHKRTTVMINETEYRQLHAAAMQQRFLEKELPSITRELRLETQRAVERTLGGMEVRQERYYQVLENLQAEIRDTEAQTQQDFSTRQAEFWRSMDEFAGNIWNETTKQLIEQRDEYIRSLQENHSKRQQELMHLSGRMQSIKDESQRREEIARNWIESAQEIRDFIVKTYDHQRFTPGEIEQADAALKHAWQNFANGIPESAISNAQQSFSDYSRMRILLEQRTAEWEAVYLAALERSRQLAGLIERAQTSPAVDLEGNDLDFSIDVNHWTEGALSDQMDYMNHLIVQLEERPEFLNTEMLQNLLDDTLPEMEKQLSEHIAQARIRVLNAQIRVNIADLVLQALQEQGYMFDRSGYPSGDMRRSYYANATSLDGSQVVIQVEPVAGLDDQSELHIHSFDHDHLTHHELRQRSKEINFTLARHGLQVGTTKTQPFSAEDVMRKVQPVERIRIQTQNESH